MDFKNTSSVPSPRIWDYNEDILIIGFGGAGGCAAIEAYEQGANPLILEKQSKEDHYSNTMMSGGAYHSPHPSGDKEALREYALAMFSGDNIPHKIEGEQPEYGEELAEVWAEYSPENEAFMRSLDPDYDVITETGAAFPDFPGAEKSKYRVVTSTYSGEVNWKQPSAEDAPKQIKDSGEAFHACIENGLTQRNVRIDYSTAVESLVVEDGAILGIKATRGNDSLYYKANKGVILTNGGFEYSKILRRNFLHGPGVEGWAFYGSPANTGDGIFMAMSAGAALSKVSKAAARIITAVPLRRHGLKIGLRTRSIGRPHELVVDNFGNRYASERQITQDPTRYLFYQKSLTFDIENMTYPRIPSWMIFDENHRRKYTIVGLRGAEYNSVPWDEDNRNAIEKGWILRGDALEELYEKIESHTDNRNLMNKINLINSVKTFNKYCENRMDRDFERDVKTLGKVEEPPFYAIPLYPGGPNTKGGIMANANREVLDWNRNPIPNLFTAGEISSAFKFAYQGGGNLAECIVFGRVAGKTVANN